MADGGSAIAANPEPGDLDEGLRDRALAAIDYARWGHAGDALRHVSDVDGHHGQVAGERLLHDVRRPFVIAR